MKDVIKILTEKNQSIATMESCTGGGVVNAITNIPGASEVLSFSAVTYSNEYKIKLGVSKDAIETYTVYSMEVAHEMAKNISKYASTDYGIGITGKLNRPDRFNLSGEDNKVYYSIYSKKEDKYYDEILFVTGNTRKANKEMIIKSIEKKLLEII